MAWDKHLLPLLGRKSESHSTREGIRDKIPWREFFQIKEAVSQIFKALSAEHIYIEIGKKKILVSEQIGFHTFHNTAHTFTNALKYL